MSITHSGIRNAIKGVSKLSTGSLSVSNSTFESNGTVDIEVLQSGSTSIIGNTIIVGNGEGVVDVAAWAAINNNNFTGTATSLAAVRFGCGQCSFTMDGNSINGLTTGVVYGSKPATAR